MKNILILTLLFFPILLISQNSMSTTHDEYKYLSKGYAYQKEMGLDGSKEGYSVKALFLASNGVQFRGLYTSNNTFKGLVVILNSDSAKPIYLGLPTNSSSLELRKLAVNDVKEKLNLNTKEKYDQALMEFTLANLGGGELATNYIGETEKNIKSNVPTDVIKEYDTVIPLNVEKEERMTERSGNVSRSTEINNNVITNHDFSKREFVNPPVVRGQNPSTGTVVIKMCIDIDGKIKTAKFTQRGSTTFNKELRSMALSAAKKVTFSAGEEQEQCGTIKFQFSN